MRGWFKRRKGLRDLITGVSRSLGCSQNIREVMLYAGLCTELKFSVVRVRERKAVKMKRTGGLVWDDEMGYCLGVSKANCGYYCPVWICQCALLWVGAL